MFGWDRCVIDPVNGALHCRVDAPRRVALPASTFEHDFDPNVTRVWRVGRVSCSLDAEDTLECNDLLAPNGSAAVRYEHVSAVLPQSDGLLVRFPQNALGKLSFDEEHHRLRMLQMLTLSSGDEVAVGTRHFCLLHRGQVSCAGDNTNGQTGAPTPELSHQLHPIAGITAQAIAAGDSYTCAFLRSGSVACWGDLNVGLLHSTEAHQELVLVDGLSESVHTALAGPNFTCAILRGGDINCWGRNSAGSTGVAPLSISYPANNSFRGWEQSSPFAHLVGHHSWAQSLNVHEDSIVCALGSSQAACWGERWSDPIYLNVYQHSDSWEHTNRWVLQPEDVARNVARVITVLLG